MNTKLRFILVSLLVSALVFSSGCGNSSVSAGSGESKDTLVVAVAADSGDLNPHGNNSTSLSRVKAQVYESLFFLTYDNKLESLLAADYQWEDDITLIIHLRQGVKFHCGGEMKAKDVLFSLSTVQNGPQSTVVDKIDFGKSSVIDDYTVKLVTKEPYSPLVTNLSYLPSAIFSEEGYKAANGDFTKGSLGTGPFTWGEWISGSSQKLHAFEDYWGEAPGVKNIEFKVIAEATNRVIELETGGCDIAYDISANDIPRIEEADNMVMSRWFANDTIILGFNCQKPPFDNPKVRKAISMAFDREDVWLISYSGTGGLPVGFIEKSVPGAVSDIPLSPYDVEGAKALLAEAGYPGGFSCHITCNTSTERMAISEYLHNALKDINVDLQINALDVASVSETLTVARTHELYTWSIWPATGDIDYALRVFHSNTPPTLNIMGYSNPEYDALVDAASAELDETKRLALQRQAQEILYEEYPVIPLVVRERLYAHAPNVKGFADGSSQTPILKTVYFE